MSNICHYKKKKNFYNALNVHCKNVRGMELGIHLYYNRIIIIIKAEWEEGDEEKSVRSHQLYVYFVFWRHPLTIRYIQNRDFKI